ncbi:MAG: cobaltochelatase subunit CobN [Candidatus Accumulibacter sp.]|jgi:cobaltochelatase CobN|nr:cobaltochelatase subunit CobN [Accumulibacter sp.]
MHLLSVQPGGFVDDESVVARIAQDAADIVLLSAADTTLALLAQTCPVHEDGGAFPTVRLANLLHLRQPASIDLYADEVLQHARLIVIDHLGGESYWPYGTERVGELCRSRGIALAMFSGDLAEDPNLLQKSTVDRESCRTLWRYLREGGAANAREFYRYLGATFFGLDLSPRPPRPLPAVAVFHPAHDVGSVDFWRSDWIPDAPCVAILLYCAHVQAGNTAVFRHLCDALLKAGMNPLPIALLSLKDPLCLETVRALCRAEKAEIVLNTTAFARSATGKDDDDIALAGDAPVLQLVLSGSNEEVWRDNPHGLTPRDIAMHVALPEIDGRILTRAVSFKGLDYRCERTQSDVVQYRVQPERMAFVVELARRWLRLRRLPNAEKRLALVLANYPPRDDRLANGVGLDTPASVVAILEALRREGYALGELPADGDALIVLLKSGVTNDARHRSLRPARQSLALAEYEEWFAGIPEVCRQAVRERWGEPQNDPMLRRGRFMIAGLRCGRVFVGLQPARGRLDRPMNYHDPDLPPPHHYLAFYLWLRKVWQSDAIVHVGKHGNLEWLPGKSVALSDACWPDLVFGPLPHLYPFIVNDPGEGTQAKRRAQAVIVDHLMPPLTRAESHGPARDLERQVDEYYEALMLDPPRAAVLRRQILEHIVQHDLHRDLGLAAPRDAEEEQRLLNRADAYLCELKEAQIRDGLHIFGSSPRGRQERDTLLALARHPVGDGREDKNSLLRALAADLHLDNFDPLDADWAASWQGPRPAALARMSAESWRHAGDTRERIEWLALDFLEHGLPAADPAGDAWPAARAVFDRIESDLRPKLAACGEQETRQLLRGLSGRFVPPGPSGAPTRGRPDTLPTGRNFYSLDLRAVPTRTSWTLGVKSAARLIERYTQEHGDYPRAIGLSVWGTATMRTGGDDIAQAFALIGARPKWDDGSGRVSDFEILPTSLFDRPRVDVTLRVSGFFRDAFLNVIRLFDAAVQKVAEQDEPEEVNPIRARIRRETDSLIRQGVDAGAAREQAGYRVFSEKPGAYGTGLQELIDSRAWNDDADLAKAYLDGGGYAYGRHADGAPARNALTRRMAGIELVLHNQDNREHDLLDSDDYYQFQGGMAVAARHCGGRAPAIYFGDHSDPETPRIRTLEEEISRVVRARVTNPKWIEGVKRHGYKGAFEMAATVDYLFAFDATARVVRDDQYARVADAFIDDPNTRAFLERHNPDALHEMCERLLEAIGRGLWQNPGDYHQRLENRLLEVEQRLEDGE